MAFDQEERNELKEMFSQFRDLLGLDTRVIIRAELVTIKRDLANVKENISYLKRRVDDLFIMESEDIKAAYADIENLKKR